MRNADALDTLLEAAQVPKETFTITTHVHLGWKDRLRALFGRVIHVRTIQRVWVVPQGPKKGLAHDQAVTTVYVDDLIPRRSRGYGGYEVREIGQ